LGRQRKIRGLVTNVEHRALLSTGMGRREANPSLYLLFTNRVLS
jgi:hypothetical protein